MGMEKDHEAGIDRDRDSAQRHRAAGHSKSRYHFAHVVTYLDDAARKGTRRLTLGDLDAVRRFAEDHEVIDVEVRSSVHFKGKQLTLLLFPDAADELTEDETPPPRSRRVEGATRSLVKIASGHQWCGGMNNPLGCGEQVRSGDHIAMVSLPRQPYGFWMHATCAAEIADTIFDPKGT